MKLITSTKYQVTGAVQSGGRPPVKILPPPCCPSIKFMIKHIYNLLGVVHCGSIGLCLPSCNCGYPTAPQNVNPKTASEHDNVFNVMGSEVKVTQRRP